MDLPNRSQRRRLRTPWTGAATFTLVATFAFQSAAQAQVSLASSNDAAPVTYAVDVASIIQGNCQVCHRAGGIGPMHLMTYENVKLYAPLIKFKVENRIMPPYYYDTDIGIQELKHDWRLSQEAGFTAVTPLSTTVSGFAVSECITCGRQTEDQEKGTLG